MCALVLRSEKSDAGARSQASDTAMRAVDEARAGSLFGMRGGTATPRGSAFASARTLVGPRLTPIGVSTTFNTADRYDRDGWATGSKTAASSRAPSLARPPLPSPSPSSSSSFMDEYRLSKNHLAHEGMTMDNLIKQNKARTDVNAFQTSNEASLKGFRDMLPADAPPRGGSSATPLNRGDTGRTVKGGGNDGEGRKRLGMGRPRKG